ncbi:hypothetical protein GLAREA_04840 [Glarea lozoyensis ATCC 20868]|uniref:Spherulin-4 n=1 Tax=Glarea lozoyensis (strain ATCC 20868 / MF5171) TaxID=1116229 RepID=S3CSJ8_GLAL2|nr:uncharacterized protein GLAREA_04840 [Glarea lozoyensis ATCC 20868]EPE28049.1 hypothetical protein GLAREA_04840 [Glarea lozoyensis ATCC 20868]
MSILVPLYIYPHLGQWDPLYWAAWSHPKVNFTVIVNPCSGPCGQNLSSTYINEIPKLKQYKNIQTLGYVATNYTNKGLDNVLEEIGLYANWSSNWNDSRISVDGIFFDETPGLYDWRKFAYLETAQKAVKSLPGLGQQIVVHNPGTLPDRVWNYMNLSDVTVIFEQSFMKWLDQPNFNLLKAFQNDSSHPKSAMAVMLHSLPSLTDNLLTCVIKELENMAGYFFLTSVGDQDQYWHSFSNLFSPLATAVDRINEQKLL